MSKDARGLGMVEGQIEAAESAVTSARISAEVYLCQPTLTDGAPLETVSDPAVRLVIGALRACEAVLDTLDADDDAPLNQLRVRTDRGKGISPPDEPDPEPARRPYEVVREGGVDHG